MWRANGVLMGVLALDPLKGIAYHSFNSILAARDAQKGHYYATL
jgi:hypothetical protein